MSEQPKKARDIKDLKARLGRGGGAGAAPGGAGAQPPGGGLPGPAGIPGPQGGGADLPPPAVNQPPGPAGGGIPAPFGAPQPAGAPSGAPSAPPSGAPASHDPFANAPAAAAAPQEVKLVIDDKAVDDAEVGRKSAGKLIVLGVAAALAGVALGWAFGHTARDNQMHEVAIADTKEIYQTVNDASKTVNEAKSLVDQAAKAASKGEVDFDAIEQLRALEKPLSANAFSNKLYKALQPSTVDALFQYYNNVNLLWDNFRGLAAQSLTPAAREELKKSAGAAAEQAQSQYGCVPFSSENDLIACGMVKVSKAEEPGKLKVAAGGRTFDKVPFQGQELNPKSASNFVILIDKKRSQELLGNVGNEFKSFARDLVEAKKMLEKTSELQGRLIKELGNVVAKSN